MTTPTIYEQIACVDREIGIRERVYPRWVEKGKLTKQAADMEMERIRAVLDTLRRSITMLAERAPGETVVGDFGPTKVRAVERAKVLAFLSNRIDSHAMYRLVEDLQAADAGMTTPRR
jgi:hypothetical protein